MRADGTFTVTSTTPVQLDPAPEPIEVGVPIGVLTFVKEYAGDVTGRSVTTFVYAFSPTSGVGSYVAMEAFEGSLGDRKGGFAYTHAATTRGEAREDEHFTVVPGSGTGALAGISGGGGMAIDADGTHRIWFDVDLAPEG